MGTIFLQRIQVAADAEALAAAVLRIVDVEHAGQTQRSPEEAERLSMTHAPLLRCWSTDRHGIRDRTDIEEIIVVSPYNM